MPTSRCCSRRSTRTTSARSSISAGAAAGADTSSRTPTAPRWDSRSRSPRSSAAGASTSSPSLRIKPSPRPPHGRARTQHHSRRRRRGAIERGAARSEGSVVIVIKFGGTSIGNADRVADAIDIVSERRELDPIVVVSALAGVTNDLVAASEAAREQKPERVSEIIRAVRQRHEDVAMRLVQQKFDFFEAFIKQLDRQIEEVDTILRGISLLGEITPRASDKVLSIGEKLSSVLFAYTMMMRNLPAEHVHS